MSWLFDRHPATSPSRVHSASPRRRCHQLGEPGYRDPQHLFARELLGSALWKNGDAVRARDLLSKAAAQPELGNEGFWRLALAAQAGDLDAAFELLPRLIDARDPAVIHLAVAPQ